MKEKHKIQWFSGACAKVDLDPYDSPSVFLDSAVQSVVDGGILMCTATDMAVLCGGGTYCHEMVLRILLASIESHANRYKRYIVPVLSVQNVRVFLCKLSYVYQCTGCDSFHLQPLGRTVSKELPDVPLLC
ncbi:putative tRNA (guanine(26)-N(2))-dimethyltransferase 2 [Camellia lanceoleosa]|uniref:tRNA (Guanine(26)-N(2))-dimethyltransferase 2 n=1 Tax=Camellia lanceoleosa TaxID=1840588 RepID=A0ACC0IW38_9ERIC|nr:putative tRNA (guanine(26)-N(2))-dimethyltransferase 2 [Camellia lanceoleosa]